MLYTVYANSIQHMQLVEYKITMPLMVVYCDVTSYATAKMLQTSPVFANLVE